MVFLLAACGEAVQPTVVVVPTINVATPTKAPPTVPPTPVPTATLNSAATNEWGTVKSIGAEVRQEPNPGSPLIEKLAGFTVVAWQSKLIDESWFERAGGGWVRRDDVVVYRTEAEARRAVPQATPTDKPVPTYNPNPLPTGKVNYTFAPVVGPGAAPQYFTQAPPPPQPTPVPGSQPTPTAARPTATPLTIQTVTPKPTFPRGVTPTASDPGNQ